MFQVGSQGRCLINMELFDISFNAGPPFRVEVRLGIYVSSDLLTNGKGYFTSILYSRFSE